MVQKIISIKQEAVDCLEKIRKTTNCSFSEAILAKEKQLNLLREQNRELKKEVNRLNDELKDL